MVRNKVAQSFEIMYTDIRVYRSLGFTLKKEKAFVFLWNKKMTLFSALLSLILKRNSFCYTFLINIFLGKCLSFFLNRFKLKTNMCVCRQEWLSTSIIIMLYTSYTSKDKAVLIVKSYLIFTIRRTFLGVIHLQLFSECFNFWHWGLFSIVG